MNFRFGRYVLCYCLEHNGNRVPIFINTKHFAGELKDIDFSIEFKRENDFTKVLKSGMLEITPNNKPMIDVLTLNSYGLKTLNEVNEVFNNWTPEK